MSGPAQLTNRNRGACVHPAPHPMRAGRKRFAGRPGHALGLA